MSEQQTIYRVGHRTLPFTPLANAMIRDKRVPTDARFMLVFIMSYPPDWEFRVEWLQRELSWGRDKTRKAVKDLVDHGYCKRDRTRNGNGTLAAFSYFFTDIPNPGPENQSVVKPTKDLKPVTGNQGVASNKDTNQNHKKDPPLPPEGGGRSSKSGSDDSKRRPAQVHRYVTEEALNRVPKIAPGWDRQMLLKKFMAWPESSSARDMDASFLGWVKSFTKGKKA